MPERLFLFPKSLTDYPSLVSDEWAYPVGMDFAPQYPMKIEAPEETRPVENRSGVIQVKSFICPDCGKIYAVSRSLWRHRKFECINSRPNMSCPMCPFKTPHKWRYINHMKKYHLNEMSEGFDYNNWNVNQVWSFVFGSNCLVLNWNKRLNLSERVSYPDVGDTIAMLVFVSWPWIIVYTNFLAYHGARSNCNSLFDFVLSGVYRQPLFSKSLPPETWQQCKRDLICLKCSKHYSDWRSLKKHMDYFCQMEPLYPCPFCHYRARISTFLKYHILREHTPVKQEPT